MIFDAYIYFSIYITLFSHCSDILLVIELIFEMMAIILFLPSVLYPTPPPLPRLHMYKSSCNNNYIILYIYIKFRKLALYFK